MEIDKSKIKQSLTSFGFEPANLSLINNLESKPKLTAHFDFIQDNPFEISSELEHLRVVSTFSLGDKSVLLLRHLETSSKNWKRNFETIVKEVFSERGKFDFVINEKQSIHNKLLVWPKERWRNLSFSIVSDYLALKEEDLNQEEVTHHMLRAITRILSLIISLVDERTYIDKFYKELTANDLGKTGSHQVGIAIPKDKHLFFGLLDETRLNPDVRLDFFDKQNNKRYKLRFIYYNNKLHGGTRNEYRLSWAREFLQENNPSVGDVIIFERKFIEGKNKFLISLVRKEAINLALEKEMEITNEFWLDPSEISGQESVKEGEKLRIEVNKYERSRKNRLMALAFHGYDCSVCNLNFVKKYGEIGNDFIHIHHTVPISKLKSNYQLNIEKDLIPVCPNCHAMLHKGDQMINRPFTVKELKKRMLTDA